MAWEDILKAETHLEYLRSKLKPIMGDLTDSAVGEFQQKFSDKNLKNWYMIETKDGIWGKQRWDDVEEPTFREPEDYVKIQELFGFTTQMLDDHKAVQKWFKQYGGY